MKNVRDSHKDGSTVTVCPMCGDSRIRRRNPGHSQNTDRRLERWYCQICCEHFPEPDVKEREQDYNVHGTPRKLLEMDPDEVGR